MNVNIFFLDRSMDMHPSNHPSIYLWTAVDVFQGLDREIQWYSEYFLEKHSWADFMSIDDQWAAVDRWFVLWRSNFSISSLCLELKFIQMRFSLSTGKRWERKIFALLFTLLHWWIESLHSLSFSSVCWKDEDIFLHKKSSDWQRMRMRKRKSRRERAERKSAPIDTCYLSVSHFSSRFWPTLRLFLWYLLFLFFFFPLLLSLFLFSFQKRQVKAVTC